MGSEGGSDSTLPKLLFPTPILLQLHPHLCFPNSPSFLVGQGHIPMGKEGWHSLQFRLQQVQLLLVNVAREEGDQVGGDGHGLCQGSLRDPQELPGRHQHQLRPAGKPGEGSSESCGGSRSLEAIFSFPRGWECGDISGRSIPSQDRDSPLVVLHQLCVRVRALQFLPSAQDQVQQGQTELWGQRGDLSAPRIPRENPQRFPTLLEYWHRQEDPWLPLQEKEKTTDHSQPKRDLLGQFPRLGRGGDEEHLVLEHSSEVQVGGSGGALR